MPSTALEALTAELLGDVGKLHDEVKALREALPNLIADLEQRTAAVQTAIAGIDDEAVQAAVTASLEAAAEKIVTAAVRDTAAAVLAESVQPAARRLDSGARTIYQAAKAAKNGARERLVTLVGASILAGAFGGAAASATATYVQNHVAKEQATLIENGRALATAWPELDEKTRKRILEIRNRVGKG